MASEAPPFWWEKPDWRARLLYPVSAIYGAVARRRLERGRREKVECPVLCVGNLTVGGTGKTPVAIALAKAARKQGLKPGFLSRGHGGSFGGEPHRVDLHHDSAKHVGDEPLLLAEHAPVAVSPNRAAGARMLIAEGCDFLIMDDGFQSARIHIDYALLVVDARRGVGNGHIIPGGPVRAPITDQLRLANGLLKMGEGTAADIIIRRAARAGKPFFEAALKPRRKSAFAGKRFLAFAGIGDPAKFYRSISETGGEVVIQRSFGDHHFYADDELGDLVKLAAANNLHLVTTAKDAARLRHGSHAARTLLESLMVLEVETVFEPKSVPARLIDDTLNAFRTRRITEV
ncbi:tetraacyldisaccharide 4'-kinase [Mesorhizobium sp. NBSH29]|uniref:tetraacyldisaccharide 4'-kinase n=1 Tax=Mesorhizobium sp. NBSH29 TaxID=2654249 RepID=UPI0018969AA0|nr:tetraacyldisaccharide 4'-kinase [Mesorhizobium sp. NBSH29]QPC86866.1 tetraacyldisaccharide 4'-kinase [Mesorhizobium sp. NBSH29]